MLFPRAWARFIEFRRNLARDIRRQYNATAMPKTLLVRIGADTLKKLVIETRRTHVLGPLQTADEAALWNHVRNAAGIWKETLRYHANKPYDRELEDVAAAARWLRRKHRALWS